MPGSLRSATVDLPIGATGSRQVLTFTGRPGPKAIEIGILQTLQQPVPGAFYPLNFGNATVHAKVQLVSERASRVFYTDLWVGQQFAVNAETVTVGIECDGTLTASAKVFACVNDGIAAPGAVAPKFSKRFVVAGGFVSLKVPPFASSYVVLWDETTIPANSPITVQNVDADGVVASRTYNVTSALNGLRYCECPIPIGGDDQLVNVASVNGLVGKVVFNLAL